MLNVNALQKTLSAMSLPEIQNYASMHKNDPYVVAMALSVANTKKQAVTAQQGLAGMQQQPKVVDQDIEGIAPHAPVQAPVPAMGAAQLPEDSGIGQLPANNLKGMAEGGIVAFDDGGVVWDPMTGEWVNEGETPYSGLGEYVGKKAEAVRDWAAEKTNWKKGLSIDPAGAFAPKVTAPQNIPEPTPTASTAGAGRGSYAGYNPLQAVANTGNKLPPATDKKAPPAAPGVPSAGGAGLGGFMDFLKTNKPADPESMDAYMKRRADYLGENPTKKQMERIDKQETQALADKEEAKAMAIIRAGLGMMSGTSQHAFTNIGQGATAGLEDYITSQKDAKKLKLERDKMRDAIENAAYAYKKGDMDSYEKYAQDAKNAQNTYAAHGLSALGSVTGAQITSQAHLAAASMPGAQERLFTSLADPKSAAAKGLKNYADIMGPEAKGETAIRTAAINKWSSEPMLRQEFNNDFNSYLRMMSGQQMVSGATPSQLAALKKYGVSVP